MSTLDDYRDAAALAVPSVLVDCVALEYWMLSESLRRRNMQVMRYSTRLGDSVDVVKMTSPSLRTHMVGRGKYTVRSIVLHSAETGETDGVAEALGGWLAGGAPPKAGWHYAVDRDSVVQSVEDTDTAWHCLGASYYSVGIEHAGRASQTEAQWLDGYSRQMLERSARLVAFLCEKHGIPVVRPTPEAIRREHKLGGARGIFGHADATLAGVGGDHTDPGAGFPWDWYLDRVRTLATGAPGG